MKRLVSVMLVFAAGGLSHETLTTTVLFDREIVHILDKHCVMCHVENGPAFPLETPMSRPGSEASPFEPR